MIEITLPDGGRGWQARKGRLGLWTPAPHILLILLEGHGEGDFADRIAESFDRIVANSDRIQVFFYMPAMMSYESRLRTALTSRLLKDCKRLARVHTLTGSKIVAMGVTVANIALGNITAHQDATSFMVALRAALREAGQSTFSQSSFEAPQTP